MCKSSKVIREEQEPTFAKGMTLEQYMNKNMAKVSLDNFADQKVQQENLYQSTINKNIEGLRSKKDLYFINEIDEESVQDSVQNYIDTETIGILKSQRTKETLLQNNQVNENRFRTRINSVSMNATAFFKNTNPEKNTFRIKRMSISPIKKKTQPFATYGSITLYGTKFGQNINKNTIKEPQMNTFYGKLKHNIHENHQKEGFSTIKKQQSKGNFTKKHHIQLNHLFEYESSLNNKYIPKIVPYQTKISGIKDRISQRKNKFC